ncbi:MAG: hypothetical protein GXY44_14985 [Phycisphaerales bacterium]|nr:hypothetical protein [Phycisphaerales bacterium]
MNISERFNRIKSIEQMYEAAKAALAHYLKDCRDNPTLLIGASFTTREVRECIYDLEDAFLIRIFAEFEATLRDYWKRGCRRKSQPWAKILIDSIAARCFARESDLAYVHEVREYRNSLLHEGNLPRRITVQQARSCLCVFLSHLPRDW